MDANVTEKLLDIVDKTEGTIAAAVDKIITEAPDVVHDILVWEACQSIAFNVFCVVLILIAYYWTKKMWKATLKMKKPDDIVGTKIFAAILISLTIIGSSIGVVCNLVWLQIILTPRSFLFEYVRNLL